MTPDLVLWLTPVVYVLGAFNALHAIMRVPSPRGVVAWVLAMVTIPYLAVPAYWIFGRYKFVGYVEARRSGNLAIHHVVQDVLQHLDECRLREDRLIRSPLRFNANLAGVPVTTHNHVELLIDGEATMQAIMQAVRDAEEYALIQFFSVHDDAIGRAFADLLVERAEAGLRIYFLFDVMGSTNLPRRYLRRLRRAGVRVAGFRSTRAWTRFQINFRNHRKITVVDGRRAFVGGLNVGDAYMGRLPRFGPWRDTHAELRGPAVQTVQIPFLEDWHWATQEVLDLNWEPEVVPARRQRVLPVPTGPADRLEHCHMFFLSLIHAARRRIWIASPYFVPDHALVAALQYAALRGVDVRILLPERPDHLLVYLSGFSYFGEMLDVGARIYRYQPGFMHQKAVLVDDSIASIGTANLDNRSLYLNFEINLLVADPDFARETATMFERDFARSREIETDELTARPLWFRIAVRFARVLSPVQ